MEADVPRVMDYDANGNMIDNGKDQAYTWDCANRMTKITYSDSTSTEFTYDAFSRRVKEVEKNSGGSVTSEKRYVWCSGEIQPCEERNSSNTVIKRYYAQGEQVPAASSPADKLVYTRDHLGTVRELTDDNEAVRARYDYDPYGKRSANLITSSPLETVVGYTGHHYHAKSNLTLTWYRAYDAELGRWLSRDPIAENGGINLYQYCLSDPINYFDPDGQKLFRALHKGLSALQDESMDAVNKAAEILKALGASNRQAANLANQGVNGIQQTQGFIGQLDNSCPPSAPENMGGLLGFGMSLFDSILDDASEGSLIDFRTGEIRQNEINYREGWWKHPFD